MCERVSRDLIVIDDHGLLSVVLFVVPKTDIGSLSPHSVKLSLSFIGHVFIQSTLRQSTPLMTHTLS